MTLPFASKGGLVFCSPEALMRKHVSTFLQYYGFSHRCVLSKIGSGTKHPINNMRLLILDLSHMFLMNIADLNSLLLEIRCDVIIFYNNKLTDYCSGIIRPPETRIIFYIKPSKGQYGFVTEKLKNIIGQYYRLETEANIIFLKQYFSLGKKPDLIAIGASTGGPEALLELTENLPSNFPPILILVHMDSKFIPGFCKRVESSSKLKVIEFLFDQKLAASTITCASGSNHMVVRASNNEIFLKKGNSQKINGHCPSIDILFESVAELDSYDGVGILLTGMGSDGAKGLLKMKTAGKLTVAQDKKSSTVYGMPKVAVELNAVHLVADIHEIRKILLSFGESSNI